MGLTGLAKTTYKMTEKNCCIAYSKKDFKGIQSDPVCYDLEKGLPVASKMKFEIMSLDCGSETWANVAQSNDPK